MKIQRIQDLVASNPGQATVDEYRLVHDVVAGQAPCSMLVFGVGRDSSLWIESNAGGRTVFLEDVGTWADHVREEVDGILVVDAHYWTRRFMWPLLRRVPSLLFMSRLPDAVKKAQWDVVLVDAPRGTRWYRRGRMMSIYTASRLAAPGGDVFVHDCHRAVERSAADQFLGASHLVDQAGSMRHYRRPPMSRARS